ncbi:MAG: type IV pilus secretin PilQ [Proteobacteria bacterium]|nr:type IV pilus secretin PilQ [Pseudomonadota bacterium]
MFFSWLNDISRFLKSKNALAFIGMISIQVFLFVPQYAFGKMAHVALNENIWIPRFLQSAALQQQSNIVSQKTDEQAVKKQAKKIQSINFNNNRLIVLADGEFKKFDVYELSNPSRIAIDIFEVQSNIRLPIHLKSVRQGNHPEKVRIVLDLSEPPISWKVSRLKSGLILTLNTNESKANESKANESKANESNVDETNEDSLGTLNLNEGENSPETILSNNKNTVVELPAKTGRSERSALLKDIRFIEVQKGGNIEITLSGTPKWKVNRPDAHSAVLTVNHTHLPAKLERNLDVSAYSTPIQMINTFKSGAENEHVQIVVTSEVEVEEVVQKTKNGLLWKFIASKAVVQSEKAGRGNKRAHESDASEVEPFPKNAFVGKRVSFEFKDISIHNLLRMIADVAQKNIVVADDVQGKVTIRLKNVPWDQALELVLRSKGLGKESLGNNILRVAPMRTLEEEARMREERARTMVRQEPLVIQLIPVSYANAEQMRDRVKEVLTERGSVSVDTRTNTLIVREVASNMDRARSLVSSLDTQTPQVLIESRIVEANTNYTKEFGIQWGGHSTLSPATGNATGIAFPNTVSIGGAAGDTPNAGTSPTPQYAVNLPVAVGAGSGGGLGFVFGSAGGAFQLNLRLSALETQGHVKTISAPKVTTMDNSTARISQGISLPFSQVSASGVNTSFVEARLSLEVTPHITADGSVLMNIRAENNQPDPSNTGANGQPAIQRKEATTQVLVKDAETTVIGGIYVRSGSSNNASVPGLSRIPILGHLFKNYRETENRQELLIFITPRILNRKPAVQNF